MHDVFISFSFKDQEKTEEIINQLLNRYHITYWICTRDIRAGERYDDKIYDAIKAAKAFVLVQSQSSVESEEVPKEIRLAVKFKKTIIPFVIEDSEWEGGIAYQLINTQEINATRPTFDDRIRELAEEIRKVIGKDETSYNDYVSRAQHSSSATPLMSSVVFPDVNFVGRESELEALHQKLSAIPNKVFLQGIGGIGKSEIAKMYAKIHSKEYNAILWITFEKDLLSTFINDTSLFIQGMNRSNYPEDDDETYFSKKLQRLKEVADDNVLLIIDNFDVSHDKNLDAVCSGKYAAIFTTRNQRISQTIPEIRITEIKNDQELIELFKIEYKRNVDENDIQAIREIIKYFDKHTLSVRLIAGTMCTQRIKPQTMLEILSKSRTITEREKRTTNSVFDKIKQVFALSKLSDDEKNILMNLALIPMCGISVEYLYELCEFDDYAIIESLIDKSWVIHNVGNDEVSLHPIIADLSKELLDVCPEACVTLIRNLHAKCEYSAGNVKYEDRLRNLKITESIYNRISEKDSIYEMVLYSYAYCLLDSTQYYRAGELYLKLLNIETDLASKINYYERAAQCYVLCGESEKAKKIALEGWELVKNIPISEVSLELGRYYAGLLHRLVEAYRGLKEYDTSVYYGKICLDNCQHFYEIYEGDSAGWTRYHIARTLMLKGDLEESENMLLKALDIFESHNDLNACGCCYDIMALVYARKNCIDAALEYSYKAQKILEPLLGNSHIDIANNQRWRGDMLMQAGRIEEAQKCYKNAIAIYREKNCKVYEEQTTESLSMINQ